MSENKKGEKKKAQKSPANIVLSERIREIRKEKGYTNYEYFAYEHGISRAQYGRYENGEDLRFSSLLKLVEAFDMTFEEFFKDFEKQLSKKKRKK